MFSSAKRKKQKQVRQLQCQEQCIDHILNNFRDNRVHSFSDNLLEITVYGGLGDKFQPDVLNPFVLIYWSLLYYMHRKVKERDAHSQATLTQTSLQQKRPRCNHRAVIIIYSLMYTFSSFGRISSHVVLIRSSASEIV